MSGARRWFLLPLLACACAPASRAPAAAPVRTDARPPRFAVETEPAGTAVAAAVVVPGSAWEDGATSGTTLLTARTLLEEIRPELKALGASAAVECGRASLTLTLVAPPPDWSTALELFLAGLFSGSPGQAALDAARREMAAALALDRSSPAWQARLSGWQALYGDEAGGGPWARPACGVPEMLSLFDLPGIRAAARSRFDPARAAAVVMGPVDDSVAAAILDRHLSPPADVGSIIPAPGPPRPGRRYIERNTVTAWVTVGFRFDAAVDPAAVRLVGAILEDAASPSVERPDVFLAEHRVELDGRGGTLFVRVITAPAAAARYAAAIEQLAQELGRTGPGPGVYERVSRRHVGVRLLALATPEARAAARALALARGEAVDARPWTRGEAIDPGPAAIRRAAAALSPAARAVVGPRAARGAVVP